MLKYHEIPEHYVWNQSQHQWTKRKRGRCIGHLYTTNPSQGERHYLHILLHHISGAKSFEDLKISPDGMLLSTFKETTIAHGLLESDTEWDNCYLKHPFLLCQNNYGHYLLLSSYLVNLQNPWLYGKSIKRSWLKTSPKFSFGSQKGVMNKVLLCLQEELEGMGSSLEVFGLPSPNLEFYVQRVPKTISEEMFFVLKTKQILAEENVNNEYRSSTCIFNYHGGC